jgi:hypothetical protein
MPKFQINDFRTLEKAPTSPGALQAKITEMLLHSVNSRAKVESINRETGEYRVVLQGTLDMDDSKFEDI